ncbi:MAG: GerAB/ArcD/ProY family transporter [Negativicutes bacterium]|nr:GerAB/ArcD/ProY family transporter [Negativicutes bacterium]
MSYQPGVTGLFEALSFVFIITIPRVYLTTGATVLERGGQFSWISVLLAGLYSVMGVYLLLYVFTRIPGDLFAVSHQLLGRTGAWLISLYYFFIFWFNGILLLRQFAENTLTTALPHMDFQIVVAFYVIFAGHLCFLSLGGIARCTGLFLWYMVVLFLAICFLLLPYYNFYHLTPWQGHGVMKGLRLSLEAAGTNIGVMALFIMAPSFQNLRTIRAATVYGLGLSVSLRAFHTIVYLMVFGLSVSVEKMLPFFEMARIVYLSRYLQHIEAVLILLWVLSGLLAIAGSMYVAMYVLARLLSLPTLRPFLPLLMLLTGGLALLFESVDKVLAADALFTHLGLIGLYVIPAALFLATLLKARNKPCVRQ